MALKRNRFIMSSISKTKIMQLKLKRENFYVKVRKFNVRNTDNK